LNEVFSPFGGKGGAGVGTLLGLIVIDYDKLISSIYDCAANPELWPDTLALIRDAVGGAYALVGFIDMTEAAHTQHPFVKRHNSAWDEEWLAKLERAVMTIPGGGGLHNTEVDEAWTQLDQAPEADFQKSDFYRELIGPMKLRDTINTPYLRRPTMMGMLSIPSYESRPPYGEAESKFTQTLTPHIRRAMMINDMVDKGKMATMLYRQVLDRLSVAVFVLGPGRRLVFTNARGEDMLREDDLLGLNNRTLQAKRTVGVETAFDDALDRALKGDSAVGITGIGVPLCGLNGERAAAYVLPIAGNDIRGAMGPGHCSVFVARRGEQQPMAIEILRTLFDLTASEARVAALLSRGEKPQTIATTLDVSVNTVRSHLKHAYAKTDTADQTSLSALIHSVVPPVMEV
jgi:DNA-binding CsgD family transcriptional regulator